MMRTVFQRSLKSTSATNIGSTSHGSHVVSLVKTPATMLAFLIAITMSVLVIKSSQSLHSQPADYTPEAAVDSQTGATEQNQVENDVTGSESTQSQATVGAGGNTVTTRTVIENGQASVQMEVNGEEVPVDQNGTTHHTVTQNGGQTNIDVNVQNGQSGASSSTFSSNTSNSSLNSSSFQSQSVWVSN